MDHLSYFYRESLISALRTVWCSEKGLHWQRVKSGKIKAIIQGLASIIILFCCYSSHTKPFQERILQITSYYCVLIAAVYSIMSGIEYLYVNRSYLYKALRP